MTPESVSVSRPALACSACGGYYPGDCKCSPCHGGKDGTICDSCKNDEPACRTFEAECPQVGHPCTFDLYPGDVDENGALVAECSCCGRSER